ncbi:MAG: PhzF family phenazine biosynthesis protein [Aeromicrobium sp.]|uniref:PhzF family phenazine biosynthesis protein n=1 Tax=Aeromicrobium sp. TaxID=1871063 RepID=UPI0039E6145F
MSRARAFAQVDVFSPTPYRGNPVAVVLDGAGLDDDAMRQAASWTNLSETTFVLPPVDERADYRLRIFTPTGELLFAGHPTLGSARAWLAHGGVPRDPRAVVQECGAGLVPIRVDGDTLSFAAPPVLRSGPLDDADLAPLLAGLGLAREQIVDHRWVDNGPGWAAVRLATAEEVLALDPDFSLMPDAKVGVIGAYPQGSRHAFEIRAFAPGVGVPEDPVTGSLNASVAQWLTGAGEAPEHYTVSQGTRLGRTGEVVVTVEGDTVWIGGAATVCFHGVATL